MEAVLRLAVPADGHDGTYYVHEADGEIVACGGWSRRNKLFNTRGFAKLALMSTLPGVPLYKAFGFTEVEAAQLPMPDGTVLAGVAMERSIEETA
ncbi:GNAT family N-acetyltransferase [Kribbella pratensis]|uniref:GNAT family N-acetyltransferase n=1 Tax=Kribbella pratensis TaxID=2512112 RepID=UPI00192DBDA4|nr:hypothetical protein [Kribbella pratensis]